MMENSQNNIFTNLCLSSSQNSLVQQDYDYSSILEFSGNLAADVQNNHPWVSPSVQRETKIWVKKLDEDGWKGTWGGCGEPKNTLSRHQWDCDGKDRKITPGCATRRSLGPSLLSLSHAELP